MAWVRLHDGAMQNMKVGALSDSAFRLWIRGLCYCQTALTDGLIPHAALRDMGARRKDVAELSRPQVENQAPLWEPHTVGFTVHDYLLWNDCRDKVQDRIQKAKKRKDEYDARRRDSRELERVPNASGNASGTRPLTKPNLTKPRREGQKEIAREPFDRFLAAYPAVGGDVAAWTEWQAMAPSDGAAVEIIAGAARYAQFVTATGREPQFVKAPANFLKESLWLETWSVPARKRATEPTGIGTRCPHTPRCPTTRACVERVIQDGRDQRAAGAL